MPHESTVNPYERFGDEVRRTRRGSSNTELAVPTLIGYGNESTNESNPAGSSAAAAAAGGSQLAQMSSSGNFDEGASSPKLAIIAERSFDRADSLINPKPDVPKELTHHEDFDDDDEESEENKSNTPPAESSSSNNWAYRCFEILVSCEDFFPTFWLWTDNYTKKTLRWLYPIFLIFQVIFG